jgi:hypothetical protein
MATTSAAPKPPPQLSLCIARWPPDCDDDRVLVGAPRMVDAGAPHDIVAFVIEHEALRGEVVIVPDVVAHLAEGSESGADGRVFVGPRGATPKCSYFNRYWHQALEAAGVEVDPDVGLHVHDLRHVGNDLRSPGASLRDLMAHMGHSTQNAALVYQHVDVQRQREMAARLSKAIERAVWPTSGPGRSNAGRKAKRSARSQGL